MGPLAGVWIDRYSRKTLMVLVDLARALLVLLLPFTTSTLQIYLIGLLVSALGVVNSSSRQAVLPNLVERERITNINSLFSLTNSTIAIVAPTVAGLLIARTKLLAAFAIDSATFVLSAGLIAMISAELKNKLAPTADVKRNFWQIFWQGLVYIVKHPPVRVLVITRMLVALGAGVLQVVFVVYIRETMGWGAERFGFAMSAISVGSVVGASILSIYGQRFSPRWLFAGGTLGVGLAYIALALNPYFAVAVVILLLDGLADSATVIAFATLAQRIIPDQLRGRFFTVMGTLFRSVVLLSVGLGGVLADTFGVRLTLIIGGFMVTLAGCFALVSFMSATGMHTATSNVKATEGS